MGRESGVPELFHLRGVHRHGMFGCIPCYDPVREDDADADSREVLGDSDFELGEGNEPLAFIRLEIDYLHL